MHVRSNSYNQGRIHVLTYLLLIYFSKGDFYLLQPGKLGISCTGYCRSSYVDGCVRRTVILPDGTNVNHTLVRDGWCWWYQKYAPGDVVLKGLEKEAREARKGLWVDFGSCAAVGVESELRLSGRKRCSWASENPRFRAACQVILTGYGNAVLRCI